MAAKRKGFTLVEVIVVLVILGILIAIAFPALTDWIDKASEKRLTVACRSCVTAAQTLAAEAYGANGTKTPPDGAAVISLAGVTGTVSGISLNSASIAVDTLTYTEGAESVTYKRLPVPQYIFGDGIAGMTASVWDWAQNHTYTGKKEFLTIHYRFQNPTPLTAAQKAAIFGGLELDSKPLYIYPMAIYAGNGTLLNIQYVTPQDPDGPSRPTGPNRYVAAAFIIDGETYISEDPNDSGKVKAQVNAKNGKDSEGRFYSFQNIMNNYTFDTTQEFIDFITADNYFKKQ